MLILISGATRTLAARPEPWLGRLLVPRARASLATLADGRPWAMDNGAFGVFDAEAFVEMLARFRGRPGCLFAAVPDVVGDAGATRARFDVWAPVVRGYGYPVALVAQDGLTPGTTPWAAIDALFLGGSTEWKLGPVARCLVGTARGLGKWAHMGRVNSVRRLRYAERIGCQSVDGSGFSRFPDEMLQRADRWRAQPDLVGV
jgi:hypothetical protein